MTDTLTQHIGRTAGLHDAGTTVIVLVTITFLLAIVCMLLIFKIKEVDHEFEKTRG